MAAFSQSTKIPRLLKMQEITLFASRWEQELATQVSTLKPDDSGVAQVMDNAAESCTFRVRIDATRHCLC
jgi:hypothetical protein